MNQVVDLQDPHNWAPTNLQNGDLFINAKQVAGVVMLSKDKNEIYELETGDWIIATDGYRACNKVAGIQCVSPDSLLLPDGRTVGNPYIETDPATGTAHRFWARHITIGKNHLGKPYVSSATIVLDAKIAFADELSKIIQENKDAGRYYMNGTLTDIEKQNGINILFDGEIGVYGNRTTPEVTSAVQNFINNKRYGDKKAWTMAFKTSLQRQPCMPQPKVRVINGFASILVGAYKSDFSEKDIGEILSEYTSTGKVSGADVMDSFDDISRESFNADFDSLTEGGPRF